MRQVSSSMFFDLPMQRAVLSCCRFEELRKDEIVEALDSHLQQNATRLSRNATFAPYYDVRRTPFKSRGPGNGVTSGEEDGEVKSVVKGRGRRATRVKQEFEYIHPTSDQSRDIH
jgi:hypothetical protein